MLQESSLPVFFSFFFFPPQRTIIQMRKWFLRGMRNTLYDWIDEWKILLDDEKHEEVRVEDNEEVTKTLE